MRGPVRTGREGVVWCFVRYLSAPPSEGAVSREAAVMARCAALFIVFRRSMAMVIGPTPTCVRAHPGGMC